MVDSFQKIGKINMKGASHPVGSLVHVLKILNGGHGLIIGHVTKISKYNVLKVKSQPLTKSTDSKLIANPTQTVWARPRSGQVYHKRFRV